MRVTVCFRQELRPPLLPDYLQLLKLGWRQDGFHLRVRGVLHRVKPM
jgi:hypothetical protein